MIDTSFDPLFSITRVCVSYHPLRFCEPLVFAALTLVSNLVVLCSTFLRNARPRFFTSQPRPVTDCVPSSSPLTDLLQNTATTAGVSRFVFVVSRHLVCRGRKFLNFLGVYPTLLDDDDDTNTDTPTVVAVFVCAGAQATRW